jgi:hypothetical protein
MKYTMLSWIRHIIIIIASRTGRGEGSFHYFALLTLDLHYKPLAYSPFSIQQTKTP